MIKEKLESSYYVSLPLQQHVIVMEIEIFTTSSQKVYHIHRDCMELNIYFHPAYSNTPPQVY